MLVRRGLLLLLVVLATLQLCLAEERNDEDRNKKRDRDRRRRGEGGERRRGERGRERGQRRPPGERRVPGERRAPGERGERRSENNRGEKRRPMDPLRRRSFIRAPLRNVNLTTTEAPRPPVVITQNAITYNEKHHRHHVHHSKSQDNGYVISNGHRKDYNHYETNGNGYTNGNGNGYENGLPSFLCPIDFVRLGNSCYKLSRTIATWQDAHFACRDLGSQLANLNSAWKDDTMRKYLNKPELARLDRWIDGIYNWEEKKWIWGWSGKAMTYQGFSRRSPHEDRKWHCVLMDPTRLYRWTHRTCIERRHYICEAPLQKAVPHKDINEI